MSKLTKALTAAAGNAGGTLGYVEDVFSTYLYEGTGSTRSIDNGIDLDGEGGLVWIKSRTVGRGHNLFDSERTGTAYQVLSTDTTSGQYDVTRLSSLNTNGFSLVSSTGVNGSGEDYASWTFRKAEKFFDVVTYTGDGQTFRNLNHSINGDIGAIIVKRTDSTSDWYVLSRNSDASNGVRFTKLNSTAAGAYDGSNHSVYWTDTTFRPALVDPAATNTNSSGATYVAYLFASDAGGFGDDEDENIIKCGSYVGTGAAGLEVDLGWEPQYVMIKNADAAGTDWIMFDTMRGIVTGGADAYLHPNGSSAEASTNILSVRSQGFTVNLVNALVNSNGQTFIYIAIRRPMKTPESGTEVFALENGNGGGSSTVPEFAAPFASDLFYMQNRNGGGLNYNGSRLAGNSYLQFNGTAAEASGLLRWDSMNGMYFYSTTEYTGYMFKRATGFMDVVAYTGSSSATTQAHNLGVVPELMIVKTRSTTSHWPVYSAALTNTDTLFLNFPDATTSGISGYWNSTTPTDSVFSLGTANATNGSSRTFVAYLFATLAGVSKVGSYTGNATNTAIDCGFSNGARFVLIKRTDSTGDWFVYDSARGITSGISPYLLLNTTAAEVTNAGWLESESSGFLVNDNASTQININNANYIFLAIAQVT